MTDQQLFIQSFNALAYDAHANACAKGWWDERKALVRVAAEHNPELGKFAEDLIAGQLIVLEHSELTEALENIRHGCEPDDKIPDFTGEEAELADTVIRIMDHAQVRNLRVAEAIVAKMAMNTTRAYKHGGKAF